MRTLSKTVYSFDELSDSAKETARDWWRTSESEDFEPDYEDFERMGKLLGIDIDQRPVKLMGGGTRYEPVIYFSGFSSQGDGARFNGRYEYAKGAAKAIEQETGGTERVLIDIAQRLQAVQRKSFYRLSARMSNGSGSNFYSHSGTMSVDVSDSDDSYRDVPQEADDEIRQCMRDFADWIYRQLEAEYDYRMSSENVDENIRINEYEFDETGRIS